MATRRKQPGAEAFLPQRRTLPALRDAAEACQGCDLYLHATQTVFGEGSASARVVFVGEQPGDQEDRAGRPFVGPAGRVFDRALEQAGIARAESYVTNAVKHFSFEPRGKARLHKRPRVPERYARARRGCARSSAQSNPTRWCCSDPRPPNRSLGRSFWSRDSAASRSRANSRPW